MKKKIIIMGAAGRDFHDFNTLYRGDPAYEVVAFTAAQIPFIHDRIYPPELSGPPAPAGIPIYPEEMLAALIKSKNIDMVAFSYSDVTNEYIMERASLCASIGADFVLHSAENTFLDSAKPVISVCAVRTGCGKSGVTRFIARIAGEAGMKAVAIRHPMPYGDLKRQICQRFASLDDLKRADCSIEEREEYEPLVTAGTVVYAGVDYAKIIKQAEAEADLIIWDGGNNDLPFIRPTLELVIADPLRPGDELKYYHGLTNLRRAGCVIINKANSATAEAIDEVTQNIRSVNPMARIIKTASEVTVEADISGKKVLVIEDGPTLTHGGMSYGAGIAAAQKYGAYPVDVRGYAVGTIKETLDRFPRLTNLLPAMGYSAAQVADLERTINSTPCDAVLVATPVDLARIIDIKKPAIRVRYEVRDMERTGLEAFIMEFVASIA